MAGSEGELEEQNGLIYGLNWRGEQGLFEYCFCWSTDAFENDGRK
jgi:hypothetical protein